MTGIAAGTALITGVALYVVGRRRQSTTARVLPTLTPGLVGLDLDLRF